MATEKHHTNTVCRRLKLRSVDETSRMYESILRKDFLGGNPGCADFGFRTRDIPWLHCCPLAYLGWLWLNCVVLRVAGGFLHYHRN